MSPENRLKEDYPWTQSPLIACAPMRLIALAPLAVEVSKAGGLGFIGAGNDVSMLEPELQKAQQLFAAAEHPLPDTLPIGVGVLNWGADLDATLALLRTYRPAALWLFAARKLSDLQAWTQGARDATAGATKVWIQVGSVADAVAVTLLCAPDVLVVQGQDAGGHGLERGAGIVSLVPEVHDALLAALGPEGEAEGKMPVLLAAGGISEGRGVAAALALGAAGVVMGTRYLASPEAEISRGYRDEVVRASDGGQTTVRSGVYDKLRGTIDWPPGYGGRGVINRSYHDAIGGMDHEENVRLYNEAMKSGDKGWGVEGRLTTYAGTGVGLVKGVKGAKEITQEVREDAKRVLKSLGSRL
ncbi:hypothetical protein H2201_005663 [Coniosporium apollinis]|uniref:Nitronate monooxygenase domain-containing protein n=1 Tax=Coniosporium apollinis TaxID=61459 RepID=A0ABQ9NUI5_9PEZI|nr:hypothetical protein H2201_005663 [Coniosporium apollinis]